MRILVTGASGFLGRHVVADLHAQGIETVALGRRRPTAASGDAFVEHDLLTDGIEDAIAQARPTHLIHLAWYAEHGRFWTAPENTRWIEATERLVHAFCRAGGRHVVVAGSCAEYDWTNGLCCEESTPLAPTTPYGIAKDAARRTVSALCAGHGVACAWGRVFLPYGIGEDTRRLIPSLIDVFIGSRAPFGVNTTAERDFLHAADVAAALVTLALRAANGCFNISSGTAVRIDDLVRLIAARMNTHASAVLELATERPGEPPRLLGENRKLQALGWQQRILLPEGIERTIADRLQAGSNA